MFPTHARDVAARHRTALTAGAGVAVFLALQAFTAPGHTAESATIVPAGRLLASNCFQCHGTNGLDGRFNQLAGIPVEDMVNKLHDQQTHDSIMGAQARGYSDAELTQIATYFASLPKP